MAAIFSRLETWIKTFSGPHLQIFADNSATTQVLRKTSIKREALQLLCKIVIMLATNDICIQSHWVSINKNSLADMLSRGHFKKIADQYLSL